MRWMTVDNKYGLLTHKKLAEQIEYYMQRYVGVGCDIKLPSTMTNCLSIDVS